MTARLTPRELDVIAALWRKGSATVSEVLEDLDTELAYTTVLTVLRSLEQKGFVWHEREGRAHRFHPRIEAQEAGRGLLERIVDKVYQGSPVRLVAHLVAEHDLSAEEVDEMTALLDGLPERSSPSRKRAARRKPVRKGGAAGGGGAG
jgi:predicted transcriptional regulator